MYLSFYSDPLILNGFCLRQPSNYDLDFSHIKKYFDNQIPGSLISVEGAVNIINQELPENLKIGETIIYNRLNDTKFNTGKIKGQTLGIIR